MKRILSFVLFATVPLSGCHRQPKLAAIPPPPPLEVVSVPPPTHPTEALPEEPVIASPSIPLTIPLPPRRSPRRRTAPATAPPQVAAVPPTPVVDLGELTAGDEASNSSLRQQTEDLLKAQGRRLITLASTIAAAHSLQVEQARLYLRQANDAWGKLDVEGARTLGTKAKVLLDEILE